MEMKDILELIERIEKSSFAEARITQGDTKITLRRQIPIASAEPTEASGAFAGNGSIDSSGDGRSGAVSVEQSESRNESQVDTQADGTTRMVPGPESASAEEIETDIVSSPIVGTFYRAPTPDTPPFVEVGSFVRKGQTLCILEAMKVMNELESEHDGTILEILVENGTLVEYGTPLFRITK